MIRGSNLYIRRNEREGNRIKMTKTLLSEIEIEKGLEEPKFVERKLVGLITYLYKVVF